MSYYKSLSINSYRFWLTIIGMTVGMVVLSLGLLLLGAYTKNFYKTYEEFGEDLIYIRNDSGFDDNSMHYFNNMLPNDLLTYYMPYRFIQKNEGNVTVPIIIRGASSNLVKNYFPEDSPQGITVNGHQTVSDRNWFQGRVWTSDEIASKEKIAIINCYGAQLLFGNENPIGKYIEIDNFYYRIIGVLANSSSTEEQVIALNNTIEKMDEQSIVFPAIELYLPIATFSYYYQYEGGPTNLCIRLSDTEKKQETISNLEFYYKDDIDTGKVTISYIELINDDINNSLSEIKPLILIIIIFILIISGMITINTMFFNIKEKIPEIGIRKAMGATNIDIISQIIFEGFLYALLAFLLGGLISIIGLICFKIFIIVSNITFIELSFNFLYFLLAGGIIIFEGTFISMFPAAYGAKMKVVDAVKFE